MVDKIFALHQNGTWDLVLLPPSQSSIGCHWVYTVKVGVDGQVDRLKACLITKGYTQVYGLNYHDIVSLVAKMSLIGLFFSMVAICH